MRMNKYGRELDLIVLLTENAGYTVQQLADRLGITRRSLYYYFDYLRDCGFSLVKTGTSYRLDRSSSFFRRLHENLTLSDEEAAYICRMLDTDDPRDYMARAVRQKLSRLFGIADSSNPGLSRHVSACIGQLKQAMAMRHMVVLRNYLSPHSHTVSDRIVEPFLLMNGGHDVRCHEIRSHVNKTFKLSRMESVEIIDVPWAFSHLHKHVYTDLFMFSGERRFNVRLRLGQLSRSLMVEEYPQSEPCIVADGDSHWIFSADVVSFLGIGRFVIGLYDDIEIIGCAEFADYIDRKIDAMCSKKQGRAISARPLLTESGSGAQEK